MMEALSNLAPLASMISGFMAFVAASYWLSSTEVKAGATVEEASAAQLKQSRLNGRGARWAGMAALAHIASLLMAG